MSHAPARSVLRKKPRRCAHHVYSTRSPMSWARSSAILFSKPSPRWLENGRLFGSAQTRSTPAGRVIGDVTATGAGLLVTHEVALTNKRSFTQRRKGRPAKTQRGILLCALATLLCVFA